MKKNPSVWLIPFSVILGFGLQTSAPAADLVWSGGSGNWNVAGNWSPAQVPTAIDNVWITNNGSYTVTVPAGTAADNNALMVGGVSGTQALAIDRATLTLNGQSVVDTHGQLTLLVSQSEVTGPGNLVIKGSVNWVNGTISGPGLLATTNSGALAIGSAGVTLSRTLNNAGGTTWSGGNLSVTSGNSINNLAGTTFDITADGRLNGSATTPFNNFGLLRLSGGVTGTTLTAPVNNSGTVSALVSTLSLNLGGSNSGAVSNAGGAALNLGGGSHTFSSSSLVTGAGVVTISGGANLNTSGNFDAGTTLTVTAGTATLAPGCNLASATLNLAGSGALALYDTASLIKSVNLSGGTLGGTSPIVVSAGLSLSGGTVTNALVYTNGGLSISGNTTLNGARLVNPTNAVWSAGNLTGANGAVISNLFGAEFFNTFDGNMASGSGATPVFYNAGTFAKTNGTAALGTTSIDFQFLNTGTVEVLTNTLRYGLNQQLGGLTLLDGGALSAQAQPVQILGGSLIGTGLVTVANAQNVINSSLVDPGFPVGELDLTGNYQQTASGVLQIDLGGYVPGTGFDLVTVTAGGAGGVATLGGTLSVSLINSFVPTNGSSFTFLTASSRVGAFASFDYPSNEIGMQLSYDVTSASVKVTNLKPQVANSIGDPPAITYGSAFLFQVPANTFIDPDGDLLTYSASGFPAGISFDGATRTFSGKPGSAGSFSVKVMATDSGTPSLTGSTTFTLTVNPATLTVTANPQAKTYGASDPVFAYGVDGLQFGDTVASVLTGTLSRDAGETVAGSPYVITQGDLAAGSNYVITFIPSALTITPASLTVTADAKNKFYGAGDPVFSAHVSGFVNNEDAAVLNGTLIFNRPPGANAGTYSIAPSGWTSANYTINFVNGSLTIEPAPLSVTADNKFKVYGATDPTFTASYSGLVNGDTPSSLAGALIFSRDPGENAGTFSIVPSGLTSTNYVITFHPGTLTIVAAGLSITADDKLKTYGGADPAFTASFSGLVNGDTAAALTGTLELTREPGENVGNYAITPGGLTSTNYRISFKSGILKIAQAPLLVTADDKSKVYGQADPSFTVAYSGFVNGDNDSSLTGPLSFTRVPGETVGMYAISPGGLTSSNYQLSFISGTLTITAAALSITADNTNKVYGAVDPSFTASYAGFVNGESAAVLGGALKFARAPGETIGTYNIVPSGSTSSNYVISFKSGLLTITPALLSVHAENKTKTYGAPDPALTFTVIGLRFSDTNSVVSGLLGRAVGETVSGGPYSITQGNLVVSSNYTLSFTSGSLTITPAPLTVTVNAATKRVGTTDPAFSVTFSGFVNGETAAVLGGTLVFDRAPGETVGSYSLTPGGLTSANYAISFQPALLTITPGAPTSVDVKATGTGEVVISWLSETNAAYRVQYITDLSGTNWSDLPGDILATSSTSSKNDVIAGPMRFYRVKLLP